MAGPSLKAEDASVDLLVVGRPTPTRRFATRDAHGEFEWARLWGLQLPKAEA